MPVEWQAKSVDLALFHHKSMWNDLDPHHSFGIKTTKASVSGGFLWRPGRELHPRIEVLQTPALLLGYQAGKNIKGGRAWDRTKDLLLIR